MVEVAHRYVTENDGINMRKRKILLDAPCWIFAYSDVPEPHFSLPVEADSRGDSFREG